MAVFLTGRMLQALSYDIIQKCHENCKFSFSMLQLSVTFLGVGIERGIMLPEKGPQTG